MQISQSKDTTRWIIIIASFVIVSLILWNTYTFFQSIKSEERFKMQLWAKAQTKFQNANLETEDVDLELDIMSNNNTIPLIRVKDNKIIDQTNVDESYTQNDERLYAYLEILKSQNEPIKVKISKKKFEYIYYGDSSALVKLKYYPFALLLIIFLYGVLVFNFYKSSKMATQNKLWAGMAKETAHQIGTPLSSLIGWLEILKVDNVDENYIIEIEKDITRLQTITDRFSKIGSEPILELKDIISETENSFNYLKSRFSKQVEFKFNAPETAIMVMINPVLHSWTIENLIKNAIDAMKGKGKITVNLQRESNSVKINVSDNGKGIPKKRFKQIFEPGFTTKKRGWGLGLSLTKRIVEEYHKGKIKVLKSEVNSGTTFQISFKIR